MPEFYAAYIWDAFSGEKIFVGLFDTPEKAKHALGVVVEQSKKEAPFNTPEGRFCCFWDEIRLNEFKIDELCDFLY